MMFNRNKKMVRIVTGVIVLMLVIAMVASSFAIMN